MYPFTYHRPKTIVDAKRLQHDSADGTFLAGGQTLLPTLKQHLAAPTDVIDISTIPELHGIEDKGSNIVIRAAVTHDEVSRSDIVRARIAALAGLAGSIADRHVRHRGTIGGSVANNDPAADYPSAVLGLGATIVTDRRSIIADDFFTGLYSTVREPGELITHFIFPIPESASYAKFRSPASRFPIAGVFISRIGSVVRVAVTGAGANGVFRLVEFERVLSKEFRPEAIRQLKVSAGALLSDLSGSAEYRANLVAVLARRAMEKPNRVQSFK